MYSFIKEHRSDEVSGTTTGVVFEWAVHNIVYAVGKAVNDTTLMQKGETLDFGNTIWSDNHNTSSALMLIAYIIVCPFQAMVDYDIHANQEVYK